jgi:hypothetical protein
MELGLEAARIAPPTGKSADFGHQSVAIEANKIHRQTRLLNQKSNQNRSMSSNMLCVLLLEAPRRMTQ